MDVNDIIGLALDVGREHISEKLNESRHRSALLEYIERNSKYGRVVSLAEEFDIQGLVEYIREDFLECVKDWFFNSSRTRGERQGSKSLT